MPHPVARLTSTFLDRVEATRLSGTALAAAIGVSPQYYSEVINGRAAPSVRFMAGAVSAGLAESFAEVAEVVREVAHAA